MAGSSVGDDVINQINVFQNWLWLGSIACTECCVSSYFEPVMVRHPEPAAGLGRPRTRPDRPE